MPNTEPAPLDAAVIKPLALTVILEFVKEPTFELTVASVVALPDEVTSPVKLAFVVTLPAVSPEAVPVMFVPTNDAGVPRALAFPEASRLTDFPAG